MFGRVLRVRVIPRVRVALLSQKRYTFRAGLPNQTRKYRLLENAFTSTFVLEVGLTHRKLAVGLRGTLECLLRKDMFRALGVEFLVLGAQNFRCSRTMG